MFPLKYARLSCQRALRVNAATNMLKFLPLEKPFSTDVESAAPSNRNKGKRIYPRRFLDAVHLNRVDAVKELIKYRKKQWEERKANLTYDVLEMDIKVTSLKNPEDNETANEILEDARDMVHRSGAWPLEAKRKILLEIKSILEDETMWYGDFSSKEQ